MKKPSIKRHRRKKRRYGKSIIFFVVLFFFVIFVMSCIDSKVFDTVIEISHMQSQAIANDLIDKAVKKTIEQMAVSSADFFTDNQAKNINSVSANTLLINDFCTNVSSEITNGLATISKETIRVPMGITTGIDFFANMGPEIPFVLRPEGAASVDYETGFESVGINQVNFKIWINVNLTVQIVNPLRKEKVMLARKIMLVDTVISGEVPGQYLNFGIK